MGKKILIIDDELDLCFTVSQRLKDAGYKPQDAGDAVTALDKLKADKFDLIILDILMPNMDGVSFAAILRSRDDTKGVPIVVLTADDRKKTRHDCLGMGVSAYLRKPYDPEALLKKIKELLEQN